MPVARQFIKHKSMNGENRCGNQIKDNISDLKRYFGNNVFRKSETEKNY